MFIIPTVSEPNQTMRCVIPVDGRNLPLLFTFRYNTEADYWIMSVTDDVSGAMLLNSLPLISGVYPSANLLEQYGFLKIGSAIMVKVNPDNPDYGPTADNLGTDFQLVWGDTIDEQF